MGEKSETQMEEFTLELKRSLLGGYERESVLDYIQDMMERLEQTHMELDKTQALYQTMSDQNQQLYSQMTGMNGNMERLLSQLAEQKAELDGYRSREAWLAEQEEGARAIVEEARDRAEAMVESARREQEKITMEALRTRRKAAADAEQRMKELRTLAESLWKLLNGAGNAGREVG